MRVVVAIAALCMAAVPATAETGLKTLSDCGVGRDAACKQLIGKRVWIVTPTAANYVEVCPKPGAATNCKKARSGSFVIKSAVPRADGFGRDYLAAFPDGTTGYISGTIYAFFSLTDPAEDARKAGAARKATQEDCERRGQPKIGMTPAEAVETCWRKPRRIVKSTTKSGTREDYIYSTGHILRFEGGQLAEIIETQ